MGGGSSESSRERSGWGFRRRAMGGGIALSRKGKEKRLDISLRSRGVRTRVMGFHLMLGLRGRGYPFLVVLL